MTGDSCFKIELYASFVPIPPNDASFDLVHGGKFLHPQLRIGVTPTGTYERNGKFAGDKGRKNMIRSCESIQGCKMILSGGIEGGRKGGRGVVWVHLTSVSSEAAIDFENSFLLGMKSRFLYYCKYK